MSVRTVTDRGMDCLRRPIYSYKWFRRAIRWDQNKRCQLFLFVFNFRWCSPVWPNPLFWKGLCELALVIL